MTTDGAPSMVGAKNALIAKLEHEYLHLIGVHCIIQGEAFCASMGIPDAKPFSNQNMKIVNTLISTSSL